MAQSHSGFKISSVSLAMFSIALLCAPSLAANESNRPNILWLSAEDISPHLGCFGDPHAKTPRLDRLASEGIRYSNAFTTAGVCAPCRSGIITGMYQTTLGTQHMRCRATLPKHVRPFPTYLREAGYYCTNNAKEDYQFNTPKGTWDQSSKNAHWRNRPEKDKPFFAVFNFGGCHESGIAGKAKYESVTQSLSSSERQDPKALTTFPPYFPDTPATREDWKRNYELITAMDYWAGDLLDQLEKDGLAENTIVFFWSDHGIGLPRGKRWLYDSGTHIPLIVRIPEKYRRDDSVANGFAAGSIDDRLISSIDFGPTVLNLAGLDAPEHVQGQPFLAGSAGKPIPAPRKYVYGARDRMDERYDIIRMVRDKRYKYIRNYEPLKPYFQYMNTPEKGATMKAIRTAEKSKSLPAAALPYFRGTKPVEELYDINSDPQEINNLAESEEHAEVLARMRSAHKQWVTDTRDVGLVAEPILAERAESLGSQYATLRQSDDATLSNRIAEAALAASDGPTAAPQLVKAIADKDSAVRYWGATGIGNLAAGGHDASENIAKVQSLLDDPSVAVRIAAARALCHAGQPEDALAALTSALDKGKQWERLQAAIVLDEIDEQAKPVLDAMHDALKPKRDLYAGGKYAVRVINRALNELKGTTNVVK